MTCVSTLRRVWPISLCVNYDSDDEGCPSPRAKPSEKSRNGTQGGYRKSQIMHNPPTNLIQSPMTEKSQTSRVKTSKGRAPPMPSLPQQFYDLPPDSRARSPDSHKPRSRSRSRSHSRNRLVKPRTPSFTSPRSRPSIGVPADFRKVAGHDRPIRQIPRVPPIPVDPQNPPMDSWRRVSKGVSKRVSRRFSYRPLELLIHQAGHELQPLPRFSRIFMDPSEVELGGGSKPSSRPTSIVRMTSRSRSRRSAGSRKSSPRKNEPVPKMPVIRNSTGSVESDVSFDDAESVIDPDFNPGPRKSRQSRQPSKKRLTHQIEHIRPPVPLKTKSLLPSPRDERSQVSPITPAARERHAQPPSPKLDDLPSAFSSPASPTAWPEAQDPFQNLDAAVEAANTEVGRPSIPYSNNTTHRVSTPERSLNPSHQSPPREVAPVRASPTPSAASTISTAMSNVSGSTRSMSTAATSPPSPISDLKKGTLQHLPKAALAMTPAAMPHATQMREMVVQRVVADAPLLQPAPRIPNKGGRHILPMIEETSPTYRADRSENEHVLPSVLHAAYGPHMLPKRAAPIAVQQEARQDLKLPQTIPSHMIPQPPQQLRQAPVPEALQLPAGPQQFNQQARAPTKQGPPPRPARPDEPAQAPPRPARPDEVPQPPTRPPRPDEPALPQLQTAKPQLQVQTNNNAKSRDWAHTGSAWREVVWGLKRRTQEEAAIRAREQQVVIETASMASSQSDNDEAWRNRDMQFGESPLGGSRSASSGSSRGGQQRSNHWRGPSNGSGGSHPQVDNDDSNLAINEVMEVPVGLALGGMGESVQPRHMMGPTSTAQSNDALLHLQPSITHDMHAIVEEDEEDEDRPPQKPMLSVRNGMPESDSEDEAEDEFRGSAELEAKPRAASQTRSIPAVQVEHKAEPQPEPAEKAAVYSDSESDSESGEEVEFGIDDGMWEMVESNPASAHASLANARESVKVVEVQESSTRNSRMNRRSMSASAAHSRESSRQSSRSNSSSTPSPSRGSRGSMYFGHGSVPDFTSGAPPMPPVPTNIAGAELQFPKPPQGTTNPKTPDPRVNKPKTPEPSAKTPKTPTSAPPVVTAYGPPEKWGKGLGVEFGIAY